MRRLLLLLPIAALAVACGDDASTSIDSPSASVAPVVESIRTTRQPSRSAIQR